MTRENIPQLFLAPMVRVSTLPFRLLALKYGAKKVFTPELIDKAIISSVKMVDPETGVISFVSPDRNTLIWSTHPSEKDFLVFQLGSSDPQLAVKAFKVVKEYISEINLNAGCPKFFSIQAGMGAALLRKPDLLASILNALGEECIADPEKKVPLSVKLRLVTSSCCNGDHDAQVAHDVHPSKKEKISLEELKDVAESSSKLFSFLATRCPNLDYVIVHSRRISDRTEKTPAFWDVWDHLLESAKLHLVANGDFLSPCEIQAFWEKYNKYPALKGLLIARGAQSNPSIFLPFSKTPSELVDVFDICKMFIPLARTYTPMSFTHIKYTVLHMLPKPIERYQIGCLVLHATSWQALLSAFNL
ncbi:tRNA-dihydrouridine synthase 2 [Mitosporidium daphniae]